MRRSDRQQLLEERGIDGGNVCVTTTTSKTLQRGTIETYICVMDQGSEHSSDYPSVWNAWKHTYLPCLKIWQANRMLQQAADTMKGVHNRVHCFKLHGSCRVPSAMTGGSNTAYAAAAFWYL